MPERASDISDMINIINDLRPINLVNGEGFKQILVYLETGYTIPSNTHFTHFIERKHVFVKEKVLQHKVNTLAITADMWTSIATELCNHHSMLH